MLMPGGTYLHRFYLPFPGSEVDKAIVTYKQKDDVILEKTVEGGFVDEGENGCHFDVELSQKESLLFIDEANISFQINVINQYGTRIPSEPMCRMSGTQLHKDII